MLESYINAVCDLLGIVSPKVAYTDEALGTDTMLAAFDPTDHKILVKTNGTLTPDTFFSIAHELRHAYQRLTDPIRFFGGYKTSSELPPDEYNLQPAELDANAFAVVIMTNMFGLKPLFEGLNKQTVEAIYSYAQRLAESL